MAMESFRVNLDLLSISNLYSQVLEKQSSGPDVPENRDIGKSIPPIN
jgi:hypothetical protein